MIRQIKPITETVPIKPNSSPNIEKIKSVCFSGKKSKWDCDPFVHPLPNKPPEPTAICDCIIWYPDPNGSFSGLNNVKILLCWYSFKPPQI